MPRYLERVALFALGVALAAATGVRGGSDGPPAPIVVHDGQCAAQAVSGFAYVAAELEANRDAIQAIGGRCVLLPGSERLPVAALPRRVRP